MGDERTEAARASSTSSPSLGRLTGGRGATRRMPAAGRVRRYSLDPERALAQNTETSRPRRASAWANVTAWRSAPVICPRWGTTRKTRRIVTTAGAYIPLALLERKTHSVHGAFCHRTGIYPDLVRTRRGGN